MSQNQSQGAFSGRPQGPAHRRVVETGELLWEDRIDNLKQLRRVIVGEKAQAADNFIAAKVLAR